MRFGLIFFSSTDMIRIPRVAEPTVNSGGSAGDSLPWMTRPWIWAVRLCQSSE